MSAPTVSVKLSLFGEERTVEIRGLNFGRNAGEGPTHVGWVDGFVATIGRGVARYPVSLDLWRVYDDKPAHRANYIVTADDGSVWQFHLSTVARNRQAQIVGWADTAGVTNDQDQTRRNA